MAFVDDKAMAERAVIVAEGGKEQKTQRNDIYITILIDKNLFSDKFCKALGGAFEGGKSPWGWGLGQVKGCLRLEKEPQTMEGLFDWHLLVRAVDNSLAIDLCRPAEDLTSANKLCFAGFKLPNANFDSAALSENQFVLLVAAGLLEQTPIFMNNSKLNPRRIRLDKRLPLELQRSLRSSAVEIEFKNDAKEIQLTPADEESEKTSFMNFSLSGQVRRAIYEKHLIEILKKRILAGEQQKVVDAVPWVPPMQQENTKKDTIQVQKKADSESRRVDNNSIKFDVELATELFSKEACHIFQSLMDVGIGPWFLKLGDFSACKIQTEAASPRSDLNHWKIIVESSAGELEAAICRPTELSDEPEFVCYSKLKLKAASGFFAAMHDVRFVNLLLGSLYELAPVSAYGTVDAIPGGHDKRFPDELAEPAKLRPMELNYVKGGQFYKLIEIRKGEKGQHAGERVFWSRVKSFKPRQDLFVKALSALVQEINAPDVSSSPTSSLSIQAAPTSPTTQAKSTISSNPPSTAKPETPPSQTSVAPTMTQVSRDALLAEETRLKAAKAAAAAKETALKADAEAREAAAQAAAAKSYAAAQEAAAREAAKREAAAKEAAAKEAAAREKAAREAAQEYARQAERDAAIKEAVLKANAAREAAQRAEAAARAAVAAAKLVAPKDDIEVLEEQIPPAEDAQAESSRKELRFFVLGLPVQEIYRDRMPAQFKLGFDSGLWGNDSFNIGVWADFGRTFFIQKFKPDVVPNDVDNPDSVATQFAIGERAQSRLGLSLAANSQFNNSQFGLSLQVGSVNFTSKWDYDRSLVVQALGQVDGTATTAGINLSLAPVQALGGFVFEIGTDFLSGRGLSGNTYSLDLGWRFLNYSGTSFRRRLRAKFDFLTAAQLLAAKSKNLVDGETDNVKSTSVAVGVRISLL
jgi:hypothetical protein